MAHPSPSACCDAVLYCVIGRAAPHPINSWPHDTPDLGERVSHAKSEARTKAVAAGHEISFIFVPGTGPIAPIDIEAMVAQKVAEVMARLPTLKNEDDSNA